MQASEPMLAQHRHEAHENVLMQREGEASAVSAAHEPEQHGLVLL